MNKLPLLSSTLAVLETGFPISMDASVFAPVNGVVMLSDARYFSDATFVRDGYDLLLRLDDGSSIRIEDYFATLYPPIVEGSFNGQSLTLNPQLVQSFLLKAGQPTAQLDMTEAPVVGEVTSLEGEVFVIMPDGSKQFLNLGDAIFQGDVIETASDGSIKMTMLDDTLFSLGTNSRFAVDRMMFDEALGEGESLFSVLKGSFLFVSGKIAKADPADMSVSTPVATIGVRGTIVSGEIGSSVDGLFRFSLLEGGIVVNLAEGDSYALNEVFQTVERDFGEDVVVDELSLATIVTTFRDVFDNLNERELNSVADSVSRSVAQSTGEEISITIDLQAENPVEVEGGSEALRDAIQTVDHQAVMGLSTINAASDTSQDVAEIENDQPVTGDTEDQDASVGVLLSAELEVFETLEPVTLDVDNGDNVAPEAVSISLLSDTGVSGDGISRDGTVNVTGLEAGSQRQYSLDAGGSWHDFEGDSFVLSDDGEKSVTVRQIDVAGNVSAISDALAFSLDGTIPGKPALSFQDTGNTGDGISHNGTVNVAGLEAGSQRQYSLDAAGSWHDFEGDSFVLSDDGEKSVTVRQIDVAGNISVISDALAFSLDTQNTAIPTIIWPSLHYITDDGQVQTQDVRGRVDSGAVQVSIYALDSNDNIVGAALSSTNDIDAPNGSWSLTGSSGVPVPVPVVSVASETEKYGFVSVDVAGNLSTPTVFSVTRVSNSWHSASDTTNGTDAAETIFAGGGGGITDANAGGGDDLLYAYTGNAMTLHGDAGDDILQYSQASYDAVVSGTAIVLDGGDSADDHDQLRFDQDVTTVDLSSSVFADKLDNFEAIHLDAAVTSLSLNFSIVQAMTDSNSTLYVTHEDFVGSGGTVGIVQRGITLSSGFTQVTDFSENGVVYNVYTATEGGETVTLRVQSGMDVSTLPVPAIGIDSPLAGDGLLNAAEAGNVEITGSTTGVSAGHWVSITISDVDSNTGQPTADIIHQAQVDQDGLWALSGIDLSGLDDGNIYAVARVSNALGDEASTPGKNEFLPQIGRILIKDTVAPDDNGFTVADQTNINSMQLDGDGGISLSGTGEIGAAVSIRDMANGVAMSTFVDASGNWESTFGGNQISLSGFSNMETNTTYTQVTDPAGLSFSNAFTPSGLDESEGMTVLDTRKEVYTALINGEDWYLWARKDSGYHLSKAGDGSDVTDKWYYANYTDTVSMSDTSSSVASPDQISGSWVLVLNGGADHVRGLQQDPNFSTTLQAGAMAGRAGDVNYGDYNFTITQTDYVGNSSNSVSESLTVTRVAPTLEWPAAGMHVYHDNTVADRKADLEGSVDTNLGLQRVELFAVDANGATVGKALASANIDSSTGAWKFDFAQDTQGYPLLTASVSGGTQQYVVVAYNAHDHESAVSDAFSVTRQTTEIQGSNDVREMILVTGSNDGIRKAYGNGGDDIFIIEAIAGDVSANVPMRLYGGDGDDDMVLSSSALGGLIGAADVILDSGENANSSMDNDELRFASGMTVVDLNDDELDGKLLNFEGIVLEDTTLLRLDSGFVQSITDGGNALYITHDSSSSVDINNREIFVSNDFTQGNDVTEGGVTYSVRTATVAGDTVTLNVQSGINVSNQPNNLGLTIIGDGSADVNNGGKRQITFTFAEAVEGFEESDITVINGSLDAGTLGTNDDGITWTVEVSPDDSGVNSNIAVRVAEGAVMAKTTGHGNVAARNITSLEAAITNTAQNSFDFTSSDWDTSHVTSMRGTFAKNTAFNQDIGNWNVSSVTDMNNMFHDADAFNQDIGNWNVSSVTDMSEMFLGADAFNGDISGWNVSNVTNMDSMFSYADAFNQNIGGWDVGKVTSMRGMFSYADAFNGDIGNWDVGKVTNMGSMFSDADAFNQDIGSWDVSKVTSMWSMFSYADAFNQNIGGWDVSEVIYMGSMFSDAVAFNQDISGWNVSSVTNMDRMFLGADAFNQDIGNWDVGKVTNMGSMFSGVDAFDQDISGWDVRNVTDMSSMFADAGVFNQDIGSWDVSNVTNMGSMFDSSGMSMVNIDATLQGWSKIEGAETVLKNNVTLGLSGVTYSDATTVQYLKDTYSWTIDGTQSGNVVVGNNSGQALGYSTATDNLIIHALGGDNTVTGGSGDDSILGGAGDDTLTGGDGADQFIYRYKNAGNDTIADFDTTQADIINISHLLVGYDANSTVSDFITAAESGRDIELTLRYKGSNTAVDGSEDIIITLSNKQFAGGQNSTQYIDNLLANGNLVLLPLVQEYGTSGDDNVGGSDTGEYFFAGAGNDNINSYDGNDIIISGSGKNVINSGNGDDIIYTGSGFDSINAGDGDDRLIVSASKITNAEDSGQGFRFDGSGGTDTLVFAEDVSKVDLSVLSGVVVNIEAIDLNNSDVKLSISEDDILDITNGNNRLTIEGQRGDKIDLDAFTVSTTNVTAYTTYTKGNATLLVADGVAVDN